MVLEAFQADVAITDILVPVDAGAERDLGVVRVDGAEAVESDSIVELGHGGFDAVRIGYAVSRAEAVLGVEADP